MPTVRDVSSLRAQVMWLVTGAVLCSVVLLSVFGIRTASVQFRATVAATRSADAIAAAYGRVRDVARTEGRDALVRLVTSADPVVAGGGDLVLVGRNEAILAASNPSHRAGKADLVGPAGVRFEGRSGGEIFRVVTDHAEWLLGPGGDTLALAVLVPRPQAISTIQDEIQDASRDFGIGFNKRLWYGALMLLLLAIVGAAVLTRRLLVPVTAMTGAATRLASGDYSVRVGRVGVSELEGLARSFDAMVEGLETSERARRQMLRDVAHELRTPLTNLRAQIEAMQDGLRPVDGVALTSLHEDVRVLERLVGDVDVLARADAGKLELHLESVDLASLVDRTLGSFVASGRLSQGHLSIEMQGSGEVKGDATRLAQVLRNLVENSLQHGGQGVSVRVAARRNGTRVELSVSDNGPGVASEHLPRLFDRLYRTDPSRARGSGGAGLGLAIVKAIIDAHGGEAEARAGTPRGLEVLVRLPVS